MAKHRKQSKFARNAGTTAVSTAVIVAACGGVANAEPSQAGVSPAVSQPGVEAAPSQPGVAPSKKTWIPVPAQYQQESKPLANWDYESNEYVAPTYEEDVYVAPVDYSQLHLPVQLQEFTAPIQAPEDKVRIGRYIADRPNWMTEDTAERTNNQTAVIEAQVTDFWRSTGLETDEAERLAAAQVGGAVVGAVTGAVGAAAIPAFAGAMIGGTIGGTSAAFLFQGVPLPFVFVPAGTVGTLTGGAIGAAALGVPAAVIGGIGGVQAGLEAANAYGAGDLGEPMDTVIPDVDQAAITAQTEATLADWEANPVGAAAANAVRDMVASAPAVDQQIRDAVSSLPGGEGAIEAFDQAVAQFHEDMAVPALPIGMIAEAINEGIQV
ncbi:insoluble domain protein [Rhodococcus sp. WMMA185]|uniref:insoluble domain protein n=1 Tax=Rhodococcus sp. WMMA185 TaxID=679318 RepID=UPI0008791CA9|nr:insoluble domain protein [Rhodococcus sp. WMMA185]AOW93956.1 insoluble domain protein [Rhodococcus sp. WMMA185]